MNRLKTTKKKGNEKMFYAAPKNATLHVIGYNELVQELGITEEEAKFLINKVSILNFLLKSFFWL